MPSHIVEALFQGVWSSLTGGWFYDNHLSLFINTVHMYTWFFLFVLPFSFYIIFPSSFIKWLIYTTIILLFFLSVKLFNYQLNRMFDKNKITITEKLIKLSRKPKPKQASFHRQSSNFRSSQSHHHNRHRLQSQHQSLHLLKSNRARSANQTHQRNRSFVENNFNDCDSSGNIFRTNFNLDNSFNATTNSTIKLSKFSSSSSSSSSSSFRINTHSERKKLQRHYHNSRYHTAKREKRKLNQANASTGLSSSMINIATVYKLAKQTQIEASLNNDMIQIMKINSNYESNKNNGDDDEEDENKCMEKSFQIKENMLPSKTNFKSNSITQRDNESNQKDEQEENSIRSLFKISEESLAQLNTNSNNQNQNNIHHQKKKHEYKAHKSKQSKKKRNITMLNTSAAVSIERMPSSDNVKTSKQSNSLPGMDLNKIKETKISTLIQSASSMSSLNLIDKLNRNPNEGNTTNMPIFNGAKSDNKLMSGIQFTQIRRAQSDITFDLFEKLIKKHRLYKLVDEADLGTEDCCLTMPDDFLNQVEEQYYQEVDNEIKKNSNKLNQKSDWAFRIYLKYKVDSENLDKKISRCLSKSTAELTTHPAEFGVLTGSKSFHNLFFSSKNSKNNTNSCSDQSLESNNKKSNEKSSFSLVSSLNVKHSKANSNLSTFLSLSQQFQYQDLKQFKTTLECVELLGKNKFANKKSRLNIDSNEEKMKDNYETINIDYLKNKLFRPITTTKYPYYFTQEDYLKQGAIPKFPQLQPHSFENIDSKLYTDRNKIYQKRKYITKNSSKLRSNQRENLQKSSMIRSVLTSSSLSSSESNFPEMITEKQKSKLSKTISATTTTTTNSPLHSNSLIWSGSSLHSPLIASRNLTASASHAASAAVKIIRRDFLDRFTNQNINNNNNNSNNSKKTDDIIIHLPMTSSFKANQSAYESLDTRNNNSNDYDEISDSNETRCSRNSKLDETAHKKNENDDYYEEIDDSFYAKNIKPNSNISANNLRRRSSNDSLNSDNRYQKSKPQAQRKTNETSISLGQFNASLSPHQFNQRRVQLNNRSNLTATNSSLNNLDLVLDHDKPIFFKPYSSSASVAMGTIKPVMIGDKSLPILLKKTPINSSSNNINKNTPKQNRNHYSVGRTYEEIMQVTSNQDDQYNFDKKETLTTNNSNHYRLINNTNKSKNVSGTSKRRIHNSGPSSSSSKRKYQSMEPSFSPTTGQSLVRANSNTLSTNLGKGRFSSSHQKYLPTSRHRSRLSYSNHHSNNRPCNDLDASENLISLNEIIDSISYDNNHRCSRNKIETAANIQENETDSIILSKNQNEDLDAIVSLKTNHDNEDEDEEIKKKIYKLLLTKSFSINIPFNHFSLLAMLDRNKTITELLLAIFVSFLVAIFASLILSQEIYNDIFMVIFCFIVASCHYSLLKSVQPDSASPIHGFNSLTALSRPIYFCITCSLVVLLRVWAPFITNLDKITLYGFHFTEFHWQTLLSGCETFLLFLPVIFTLGLFPQVNTFLICVLEQLDIYFLGGTAMNNLPNAILSVLRSLFTGVFLASVLFGSIYTIPSIISNENQLVPKFNTSFKLLNSASTLAEAHNQFSQSLVYSAFCGLLVLTSYLLSRQSSDILVYLSIFKRQFLRCSEIKKKRSKENYKTTSAGTILKMDEIFFNPMLNEQDASTLLIKKNTEDVTHQQAINTSEQIKSQQKQEYLSVAESVTNSSSNSCHPISQPSSLASSSSTTPCSSTNNSPTFPKTDPLITSSKQTAPSLLTSTDKNYNSSAIKEEELNYFEDEPNLMNQSIDLNDDPLEKRMKTVVSNRIESDLLISLFIFLIVFAIHVSTVFNALKPLLNDVLLCLAVLVGLLNHYFLPHLRCENPWHMFSQPLIKPDHWSMFEPTALASLRWFEVVHVLLIFIEKNILNVLVLLSSITVSSDSILLKFEPIDPSGFIACLVISMVSMKLLRHSFCEPAKQYKIFLLALLFNRFDSNKETILIDLFVVSICFSKLVDLMDKLSFIYVYTAPWQLPWGSAFHAFAQPLSVPHSALLILQAVVSSILGTPLMPLMGSAIFLISYMRPVKFWEKNYETKRLDNTNTRLQSQFETTTADNENLNAIFYEHLTSVLQNSLSGDIMLGRWGEVYFGDFFVLSSDYLNCLVHIIEIGNGFVTFQLRGLEFKGTYCQQRELEAITEDNTENDGCCCCSLGHLKYMLSFNVSFHLKWVAWSVIARKYIVNAYRIVDNDLSLIVNFFSLRRILIDFYIKSSIYYLIKSPKLLEWLENEKIIKELEKFDENYIDYDCCFDFNMDTDYDSQLKGVTMSKFSISFLNWINHCKHQNMEKIRRRFKSNNVLLDFFNDSSYSMLVRLCFALSLVCRRALNSACTGASSSISHARKNSFGADVITTNSQTVFSNTTANNLNSAVSNVVHSSHLDSDSLASFQHGYYTLFKGDIRIQSPKDEWVFNDIEILKQIVIPAVRMGLRLHQDHFQNDSNDEASLYENLTKFDSETVITYERDPIWRYSVLNNVQSLLSLRHQFTDYSDQYKVVMLNKNYLSFRLIKLNKECVRSFWAGQQHELIFLRNKNQERGSIQNAKQVLRNIINSSCDQPIGYPIYVSQLITSYSSTHPQISKIIGPEFRFKNIYHSLFKFFLRIREHCTNNCAGSSNQNNGLFQNERAGHLKRKNVNVAYTSRPDSCLININATNGSQQHQLGSTVNSLNTNLNSANNAIHT